MKCEDVSSFFTVQPRTEISPIVRFGQRLKNSLAKASSTIAFRFARGSDPRVNERRDRWGNAYYQVYDPRTRKSAVFGSKTEIRYWLEQHYAR